MFQIFQRLSVLSCSPKYDGNRFSSALLTPIPCVDPVWDPSFHHLSLPSCLDLLCPYFSQYIVSRTSCLLFFASSFAKHPGMTQGHELTSSLQGSWGPEALQHPRGACPSLHPLMCLCVSAHRSCLVAVLQRTPTPDPQRTSQKGKIISLYQ